MQTHDAALVAAVDEHLRRVAPDVFADAHAGLMADGWMWRNRVRTCVAAIRAGLVDGDAYDDLEAEQRWLLTRLDALRVFGAELPEDDE